MHWYWHFSSFSQLTAFTCKQRQYFWHVSVLKNPLMSIVMSFQIVINYMSRISSKLFPWSSIHVLNKTVFVNYIVFPCFILLQMCKSLGCITMDFFASRTQECRQYCLKWNSDQRILIFICSPCFGNFNVNINKTPRRKFEKNLSGLWKATEGTECRFTCYEALTYSSWSSIITPDKKGYRFEVILLLKVKTVQKDAHVHSCTNIVLQIKSVCWVVQSLS